MIMMMIIHDSCSVFLQLLLMERKLSEVHPLLTLCGTIVENWQGNPIQKESLRVFFLVLQVTHYLDAGQVQLKPYERCPTTSVQYKAHSRLKHNVGIRKSSQC